ncbi:ADP-ribosylglycohydrolase [Fulvitalea axinellae]|uniref:ADP-ribosylglycohydrolase n=1 Tax=Fulvitalea axinellae TaxID=1182444 RepID=A0AAU9D503_9BACT|nr:ADP-ribosylglycohydrolase [Fulvitalea axinellae]
MEKKNLLIGALTADAFVLGCHWVYDTEAIKTHFGIYDEVSEPIPGSYHKNRHKGEHTHYGDQTVLLAKYIEKHNGFDLDGFRKAWTTYMSGYDGYMDNATNKSLAYFEKGKDYGSHSSDLAGASRIAPILAKYPEGEGVRLSIEQTKLTHNHPKVLASAEFFARMAYAVIAGADLETACAEVLAEMKNDWLNGEFEKVKEALANGDTTAVIDSFGASCDVAGGFAGALYLILRYKSYREAMVANAMAGGDSAARGMLAGMILGLYYGDIPETWIADTKSLKSLRLG